MKLSKKKKWSRFSSFAFSAMKKVRFTTRQFEYISKEGFLSVQHACRLSLWSIFI